MTRRRKADKRDILPDPKYGDLVVSKFINVLMLDGEKSTAENIVYGALDNVKSKIGQKDELNAFHDALNNIITESIVESKVNELLEDNRVDDLSDVLTAGEIVDLPNGMVEVELISWDD